jgi:hypothetical protein
MSQASIEDSHIVSRICNGCSVEGDLFFISHNTLCIPILFRAGKPLSPGFQAGQLLGCSFPRLRNERLFIAYQSEETT